MFCDIFSSESDRYQHLICFDETKSVEGKSKLNLNDDIKMNDRQPALKFRKKR